jgi:hypothetical protein
MATSNQTWVVQTENNGTVKLYDGRTGSYKATVCHDAKFAVCSGDDIQVTMKNGDVKIFSARTGSFIRTIKSNR